MSRSIDCALDSSTIGSVDSAMRWKDSCPIRCTLCVFAFRWLQARLSSATIIVAVAMIVLLHLPLLLLLLLLLLPLPRLNRFISAPSLP